MKKIKDLTGIKFGKLTVIEYAGNENPNGLRKLCKWKCLCECGNIKTVLRNNLVSGSTQGCGCVKWPKGEEYTNKLKKRFYNKYQENGGCWIWTGSLNVWGYGVIRVNRKNMLAHRISWIIHEGDIPEDLLICHTCDNPACVNPKHLWLGSNKDNMTDMYLKNRSNQPKGEKHALCKLNDKKVFKIRSLYKPRIYPANRIAKEFNVSEVCVYNIIYKRTWKHLL